MRRRDTFLLAKAPRRFIPLLLCSVLVFPADVWSQTADALIDTDRLRSMVVDNAYKLEGGKQAQYTIIDIRPSAAYHQEQIFSAINIPAGDFQASSPPLPAGKNVTIVLYGDDADVKVSLSCRMKLVESGYTDVLIYAKPFSVWKELRLPIIRRTGARP